MASGRKGQSGSLSGRIALVTGSTSGIGRAIAEALAAEGADIMLNGFADVSELETLKADMTAQHGVRVSYHGADMSRVEEIEALYVATLETLGPPDILVNNAGIQHVSAIEDFPPERWDAVIAVNLSAVFHTTRLVLPHMRAQGWGRIINVSSAHGLVASVQKSAYVAAKHGVMGLTKVTALETAKDGITCNAINPGWVLTPLVQKQVDALAEQEGLDQESAKRKLVGAKMPTENFATPEQIGALACFVCSPAAVSMTGVPLSVDGGWTAQ